MKEPKTEFRQQPHPEADNSIPFPEELPRLADINAKLEEALEEANAEVERMDQEYRDTKRYMVQNRAEIDPHEMFQTELLLHQMDSSGGFALSVQDRIAKLKDSPYFARIDFRRTEEPEAAEFYIGRYAFKHKRKLLIMDWRAPVASMFYDCEVGPAGYDAPKGRIDGTLLRKRQYKIKNGKMEYALESSQNVQDDILQKELSHTSDEKMKSIISTIQKEQNQIIRNEKAKTMIIQGVAGSGKTSIALHRIAYLLYRFKDKLSARNVTILSPNKVFGDYISNVLPELGEERIHELSLVDVADVQLEKVIGYETDRDPLETDDPKWAERVRLKSTLEFVHLMDEYLRQMPQAVFHPADYTFEPFTAKAEWIQSRYEAYGRHPVLRRLEMIADDIYERFLTDNVREYPMPRLRAIQKGLRDMLTAKDTLALYKDFYRKTGMPHMLTLPAKKTLEWADVYPFLYFHAAFAGLQKSGVIKHLVVDEMQDYTPSQYAVINLLFPCQKTILGDYGQFINPNHLHTLEEMRSLYAEAEFVELAKSYRSTYEIITFAKEIQPIGRLEPMERHGPIPARFSCAGEEEELTQIKALIDKFLKTGDTALGIVAKTNREAKALYERLTAALGDDPSREIHLISPDSTNFVNGVSVTSIQMSKGLEFDEVIIPFANGDTYHTEYDRNLLYIACTRAMHRLSLTHTGTLSPLIPS